MTEFEVSKRSGKEGTRGGRKLISSVYLLRIR